MKGWRASADPEDRARLAARTAGQARLSKLQLESTLPGPTLEGTRQAVGPGGALQDAVTTLLGAAMVDTGPMARGPRGPRSGQAFPGKGREDGRPGHARPSICRDAGLGLRSLRRADGKAPCLAPGNQRQLRGAPPSQALIQYPCPGGPSRGRQAPGAMLHRDWSGHPNLRLADAPVLGLAELVGIASLPQGASLGIPSLTLS